jgi:uncharacterized membrane protein YbhN (UPF0104 family)
MHTARRSWWPILKFLVGLAILVFVGRRFALDLSRPELYTEPIGVGWLLASGLFYLIALGFAAFYWGWLLARLGAPGAPLPLARAYYVSQLGKYVPGKALAVVMRVAYARSAGVRPGVAAMTTFFEVMLTLGSGALLAVGVYQVLTWQAAPVTFSEAWAQAWSGLWLQTPEEGFAPRSLRIVSVVLTIGMLWAAIPPVFNRLADGLTRRFRDPATRLPAVTFGHFFMGLLLGALGWLFLGASFVCTLEAVTDAGPAIDAMSFLRLTSILAIAFVAGFLVVFVPAGLGAREFFLMILLTPEVTLSEEVARGKVELVVVLLRVVWTVAEVVAAAALLRVRGGPT